jgi:3-methyladenine DNA glycosylase AlkD
MRDDIIVSSADEVMGRLRCKARPEQLGGMARFGMTTERRFGASVPAMRELAKEIGENHRLALDLWKTGVAEARIVAGMVGDPAELTEEQMEEWVAGIDSWDVCDQVCMNLFEKSPLAWKKIIDWSGREEEFVKRAAFSLIACLAWHDKEASDERFIGLFPVIMREATDERNFVKKAVNWAFRNIGKRNINLNRAVVNSAKEMMRLDSKSARWIASDALRELQSEAVQNRLGRPKQSGKRQSYG